MVPLAGDIAAFSKRFGCEVYTIFNMTEISTPIMSEPNPLVRGTCGRKRDGVDVRLVDDNDCEVPIGSVGEMLVRTDRPWGMNSGYYKNPQATAAAWRNGWFHTGDSFRQDADDNFYFVDRKKDAIRRRGENISSFEVEADVTAHPSVREYALAHCTSSSLLQLSLRRWPSPMMGYAAMTRAMSALSSDATGPAYASAKPASPGAVQAAAPAGPLRAAPAVAGAVNATDKQAAARGVRTSADSHDSSKSSTSRSASGGAGNGAGATAAAGGSTSSAAGSATIGASRPTTGAGGSSSTRPRTYGAG
jgi:hypothetical protein